MLLKIKAMLRYPIPFALAIFLIGGSFFLGRFLNTKSSTTITAKENCSETMDQIRLKGYEYTHPLLLTDIPEQSNMLHSIQTDISTYINEAKSTQKADDISVYFRRLDNGAKFVINPNTTYNPASMVKVVYLLTYMKMAEKNPAILNKQIFFNRHFSAPNVQNIVDFQLTENRNYSVRELLVAMIKHSDNDATLLLSQNMDGTIYNNVFIDLAVPIPSQVGEYFISVTDFSKFFRVLYSASYTTTELSEYALELLTTSTFKDGLKQGLDENIAMAHKFGERILGTKAQLHEFGIVYYKNAPYLIGVMTIGNSQKQLSTIIGDISKIAFNDYKNLIGGS